MSKFHVGDKEFETKPLRGREGRATTGYLLKKVSDGRVDSFIDLIQDPNFLEKHLPVIVGGKEDANYIDENASSAELFRIVNIIAQEVGGGFDEPEVSAALKNSPDTQGEEDS